MRLFYLKPLIYCLVWGICTNAAFAQSRTDTSQFHQEMRSGKILRTSDISLFYGDWHVQQEFRETLTPYLKYTDTLIRLEQECGNTYYIKQCLDQAKPIRKDVLDDDSACVQLLALYLQRRNYQRIGDVIIVTENARNAALYGRLPKIYGAITITSGTVRNSYDDLVDILQKPLHVLDTADLKARLITTMDSSDLAYYGLQKGSTWLDLCKSSIRLYSTDIAEILVLRTPYSTYLSAGAFMDAMKSPNTRFDEAFSPFTSMLQLMEHAKPPYFADVQDTAFFYRASAAQPPTFDQSLLRVRTALLPYVSEWRICEESLRKDIVKACIRAEFGALDSLTTEDIVVTSSGQDIVKPTYHLVNRTGCWAEMSQGENGTSKPHHILALRIGERLLMGATLRSTLGDSLLKRIGTLWREQTVGEKTIANNVRKPVMMTLPAYCHELTRMNMADYALWLAKQSFDTDDMSNKATKDDRISLAEIRQQISVQKLHEPVSKDTPKTLTSAVVKFTRNDFLQRAGIADSTCVLIDSTVSVECCNSRTVLNVYHTYRGRTMLANQAITQSLGRKADDCRVQFLRDGSLLLTFNNISKLHKHTLVGKVLVNFEYMNTPNQYVYTPKGKRVIGRGTPQRLRGWVILPVNIEL